MTPKYPAAADPWRWEPASRLTLLLSVHLPRFLHRLVPVIVAGLIAFAFGALAMWALDAELVWRVIR